eukprot:scaffold78494_cov71-Phaeocystis_antarctica.AAC.1
MPGGALSSPSTHLTASPTSAADATENASPKTCVGPGLLVQRLRILLRLRLPCPVGHYGLIPTLPRHFLPPVVGERGILQHL